MNNFDIINLVERMKKLLKLIFPIILALITVFLCVKNYTPGTYLIGWDSVHPEFNFPLNVSRMLSHVWGGEMGVGAISAHSDMSDLPRYLILWLVSVVFPSSFIRYFYIFSCLILGPLGMYFFLKYIFQREKDKHWVYPTAFLGALFYLLNLGTLQNFYVPLEMFPTAFAFAPWLFFLGLKYLRESGRRNLLLFSLIAILSSPMAYAATLWYATFAGLFIFLISYVLFNSAKKIKIKRVLVLGITALFLNLYWILPNFYSIVNQSRAISNSGINRLFSPEAFLRNRDYGDFKDIALQKNFLFGWRNFDFQNNQFINLLSVWIKYLTIPAVLATGYIMTGISLLGLFLGVIKREKVSLALIPTLIFTLFFLINANPPTGTFYAYLYNNFGLFSEGFRMPFTKFSVLFELITSFYFAYFMFILMTLRSKFLVILKIALFLGIIISLIYFMLPAFNGQLIGLNVRQKFPEEYTQLFNWFNLRPEGRIALFPINSKYGWEYRNWGYEGSGFLTYGIKSPILYRDFDRWSSENEDFYSQASFALYSNDSQGFINTFKKYQVRYLLLDESIINPGGTPDILKIPELKSLFAESGIGELAKFGFLTIYETGYGADVSTPSRFIQTDFDASYSPVDSLYPAGDYINSGKRVAVRKTSGLPSESPEIYEDLSINRGFEDAYNCDLKKVGKVFKSNSAVGISYRAEDGGASCDYLPYPDLKYGQAYILRIAGQNHEGRSLKIYLFNESSQVPELEEILPSGNFDETYFVYPYNQNVSVGPGPARNATHSVAGGYVLNFETRSFGRLPSENLLSKVEFYRADNSIAAMQGEALQNNLKILNVQKYGTWAYKVDLSAQVDLQGSGLIQLGQGYEIGWIGLVGVGRSWSELEHVKVNSWANGFLVKNSQSQSESVGVGSNLTNSEASQLRPISTAYLFYWPQLLEWGGGLLGLTWLVFSLYYICIRK